MRKIGLWLVAGLALSWTSGLGQSSDPGESLAALGSMEAEYQLARRSSSYFVLDIREKKMELRVKGMALRTWDIEHIKFWGRPGFDTSVELARKSVLKPPRRNVITPGEPEQEVEESGKFELEALELGDMPRSFRLDFDTGLHISISSGGRGVGGLGRAVAEALGWYVWLPIKNLVNSVSGHQASQLEFSFADPRDAQAVYWIFYDGIKGIIRR